MSLTTTRTCKKCKEKINIALENLNSGDFVKYKSAFYHADCFIDQANKMISKNNKTSITWQEALDNLDEYKSEARNVVKFTLYRDALNEYLIDNYEIAALSSYFWNVIAEIENGQYRKKRCKKISISEILDMWEYYQPELDKTYKENLSRGNEMFGEDRVRYDLAIIIKNYEKIKKGIAKEKAKAAEAKKVEEPKIDYTKMSRAKFEQKRDLSDLFG